MPGPDLVAWAGRERMANPSTLDSEGSLAPLNKERGDDLSVRNTRQPW